MLSLCFSITENVHLVQSNSADALKNGFYKEPITFSFSDLCCHPYLFKLLNTYESFFEQLIVMSFVI